MHDTIPDVTELRRQLTAAAVRGDYIEQSSLVRAILDAHLRDFDDAHAIEAAP